MDRQTDTQTAVTNTHFASVMPHAKCSEDIKKPKCSGKRTSHKAVESVLRPEGSLSWERFVKKVGFEPGVKERGSYGW